MAADASGDFLGAPPNNVTPTPLRVTTINIPEGRVARVTVSGTLHFEANPKFALCSGHAPQALPDGADVGPAGFSGVPFPFRVFVGQSDETHPAVAQIGLQFGSPGAGSAIGYTQGFVGQGWLWAGRPAAWGFSCAGGPQNFPPTAEYDVSGGQAIVADVLPDPTITADKANVVVGETVTFTLQAPAGETIDLTEDLIWRWVTESGASGATAVVSGCQIEDTCVMRVEERGHPRVDGIHFHNFLVSAVGPTIEVTTVNVAITASVTTTNPNTSFTAKPVEATISLHADVTPPDLGPRVVWRVEADPAHFPDPSLPSPQLQGAEAAFQVAARGEDRWPHTHEEALLNLAPKQLGYLITATVQDDHGESHESNTATATQDELDTIREEYIELTLRRVPERTEFVPRPPAFPGKNSGDYTVRVFNGAFELSLAALEAAWPRRWRINGIYRNPVHNRFHVVGSARNSLHQYGCAADLQTFPVPRVTRRDLALARAFWHHLAALARRMQFEVEDIDESGVGHVHVERDC